MGSCLIIDDSRVIRKVMRQILESLGYVCHEAENGQTALAACQTALPNLIFLDWNMPVMDGLAFLSALRQLPSGASPVVIFCTVRHDIAGIEQALAAGADEYIMKPFDADIIRGKLQQLGLIDV